MIGSNPYSESTGYLSVKEVDGVLSLTTADFTAAHHIDNHEFARWQDLNDELEKSKTVTYGGWELHSMDRMHEVQQQIGAFMARGRYEFFERWKQTDVDSLMVPLIRPWDSGYGVMMSWRIGRSSCGCDTRSARCRTWFALFTPS